MAHYLSLGRTSDRFIVEVATEEERNNGDRQENGEGDADVVENKSSFNSFLEVFKRCRLLRSQVYKTNVVFM